MKKATWQTTLRRVLRIAKAEGLVVTGLEFEPTTGKITIAIGTTEGARPGTILDLWVAKRARTA
jgi:hypothetical protein